MAEKKYKELLKQFVSGEIDLKTLRDFMDERLFELRLSPDTKEGQESETLSALELLILEVEDGFRTLEEVYARAQLALIDLDKASVDISIALNAPREQPSEYTQVASFSETLNFNREDLDPVVTHRYRWQVGLAGSGACKQL
ncbi:MAG: hypothetical protein Q8O16_00245 [Dehalococcoidia bacterium]|nr:hypothetical protein [Dehalococcoidia bacterium]